MLGRLAITETIPKNGVETAERASTCSAMRWSVSRRHRNRRRRSRRLCAAGAVDDVIEMSDKFAEIGRNYVVFHGVGYDRS